MEFLDFCDALDVQLRAGSDMHDSERTHTADDDVWTLDGQAVHVRAAGSTGIHVSYGTAGRIIHERTFAASPLSIGRIVRTMTEHLTGYRVR
jgi:hypothetical protein